MSTLTKPKESTREVTAESPVRFENLRSDRLWVGSVGLAIVLMIVSYFLPLWKMNLEAPQYPQGLVLTAYGNRMEGDLTEINSLNHYVGVKEIKPDSVFELKLFPSALWGTVAILIASALLMRPGWKRWLVAALLWAFPIGLLLDLQFWLYNYGHDRDPTAPYRIEDFTTKVLGTTHVVNFTTRTMVSWGFVTMVAAALLVTVGPQVARFLRDTWQNTGTPGAVAGIAGVLLLAGLAATAQPAAASVQQPSIASLIAAASPGDTVIVPPGTYREQLVIDKQVTLIGEGRPVIDGGGTGDVVVITADGVTIRGFVIEGSGTNVSDEPTAVRLRGNNAVVEDNIIRNVLYGVTLIQSEGHTVKNNQISSIDEFSTERRGHGVYLYSTRDNRIEDNIITRTKDGIFLGFAEFNTIERNTVTDVRYGIHYMYADDNVFMDNSFTHSTAGGALMYSRRLRFERNEFGYNRSEASGYGLLFKDVDDVVMIDNLIHHNRLGITMEGAPHTPGSIVEITDNLIGFNQVAIELTSTTGAVFSGNSFVGNLGQVEGRGGDIQKNNLWSLEGRGNYWDDYRGYDANGDGIGDLEYRYEGAFDDLIQRNDAIRAYRFSPAQTALDLGAKWFPVYEPKTRVVDPHPLMSPTMSLAGSGDNGPLMVYVALLTLVAVPVAVFASAARGRRGGWQPC
ncbi:MAG: nitrous oxide reductase family maturation protein NosD [Dehalococcoidia bacterium]|nr:nitrous oxide reductase family maturation protein NosD [Dehalococcoidia bacterium]